MRHVHFDFYVDQLGFSGLQGKKLVLLANLVPNKKRLHTKFGNRKKKLKKILVHLVFSTDLVP